MAKKKRSYGALAFFVIAMMALVVIVAPGVTFAADEGEVDVATQEQFEAAAQDETVSTINLTDDIEFLYPELGNGEYVLFDVSGKTIDLGGHEISAANFTVVFEGTNFTMQNGTVTVTDGGSYALFIGDDDDTENVTLDSLVLNGGVNVYNASNVVLKGLSYTGTNYYAVWCDWGANVVIEGGTYKSAGPAILGLVEETDNPDDKATMVIKGGSFVGTDGQPLFFNEGVGRQPGTIEGGTYTNLDLSPYEIAAGIAVHAVDNVTYVHAKPSYKAVTEKWSEDNGTVTVSQACDLCDYSETFEDVASTMSVTLPTTEARGSYDYEATVKLSSGDYTAKKSVEIPALKADTDDEDVADESDALRDTLNSLIASGNASEELTQAVIAAATSGETLEIKAVVDEVEPDDAELITKALEEIGLTAGPAYDVTIKVFDSKDREVAELSELTDKVYVGLDISELPAAEKGKVRDFTVVRVHDSAVTVIDENDTYVSEDGKTLYVASDKFSGYGVGYEDVDPTPVAMYRLYNPNSGEHFYTSNVVEKNVLVTVGWKYEGVAWTAPSKSATPVYRLYSGTDHHYTTSVVERDYLVSVGWTDEGIGWYSDDLEGVAIYRQFNPNVDPAALRNNSGSHNYTADQAENDALVSLGWTAEGIGWYGMADTEADA
jgi:hypothetical protein